MQLGQRVGGGIRAHAAAAELRAQQLLNIGREQKVDEFPRVFLVRAAADDGRAVRQDARALGGVDDGDVEPSAMALRAFSSSVTPT